MQPAPSQHNDSFEYRSGYVCSDRGGPRNILFDEKESYHQDQIPRHKKMITVKRTDSDNADFQSLVKGLDRDLKIRDGDDHAFFAQFNKIDAIRHAVVAFEKGLPVGCGAIKPYDEQTMEVKRMYVSFDCRGRGIGSLILQELEQWCRELNIYRCILETGERQPEAIRLYQKSHYNEIPNFGQYANIATSVCFEKLL